MSYNKPFSEFITTNQSCDYGCGETANYKFRNGKVCCSKHFNSCKGKILNFSNLDHSERTSKSLETRTRLGITKSSQIKGGKTRKDSGHYSRLAIKMQEHWNSNPWENNTQCPILQYKDIDLKFQGSYEYEFLEMLEEKHGIEWIAENVARGPSLWYNDVTNRRRLYISDFIIGNTIYEIKSSWTWNKIGRDSDLEMKNKTKLKEAISQGYDVILVLDGREINASTLD